MVKMKFLKFAKKQILLRPPFLKLNVTANKNKKRLEDGTYFQGHGRC